MKNTHSALLRQNLEDAGITRERIDGAFERATNWMLDSGIHNLSDRPKVHGAVNSWYDCDIKIYPYAYSEIAGYAIRLFLYLSTRARAEQYRGRAGATAEWIRNNALEPRTAEIKFRFYYHLDDFSPKHAYAFDTGIIVGGLAQLYAVTGDESYLFTVKELADWLVHVMQMADGSFACVYDMEDRIRLNSPDVWSKQPGPYHAKIGAALLLTSRLAQDSQLEEAARRHGDWVIARQKSDGRFLSKPVDGSTITHPHCYACEGLLYLGLKLGEKRFTESAVQGIRWLLAHQREDGGIPAEYKGDRFLEYMRTDALAQTLRLVWTAHGNGLLEDTCVPQAAGMVRRLLDLQCDSASKSESGGFYYLTQGDGTAQRHLNSWATMFAIQALGMTLDLVDDRPLVDPDHLL